jgi:hypothetical protein
MSETRVGLIRLSAQQLQHPALLVGLDEWLQLDLLSPSQVTEFCQQHLVCALEPAELAEPSDQLADQLAQPASRPAASTVEPSSPPSPRPAFANDFADDFADALTPAPASHALANPATEQAHTTPPPSSWITRTLQSFMAEIGVIWLLGLGVFMVVVSSGVLAASQWQTVSPLGQYSILLTYTLAFWGASLWTARQAALRLTAQMLQLATLLLVPVNFWMMDGLDLWRQTLGAGLNLLAAVILALISRALIRQLLPSRLFQLSWLNLLGLGLLHWGWSWNGAIPMLPLLATYLGTVGTACLTVRQTQAESRYRAVRSANSAVGPEIGPEIGSSLTLTTGVIALGTLLLLGRAVLGAGVPLAQMGLALGICGWLFCWLNRRPVQSRSEPAFWTQLGWAGLLLGWAVTVGENPAQAIAVSGLGLWLLGDRISRARPLNDGEPDRQPTPNLTWITLLLVGLQTYALLWRLWPLELRQSLVAGLVGTWGSTGMPLALLALAGFPYLWLLLGLARWQRRNSDLARLTKAIAIGFGGLLLLLGWFNPTVRAIALTLGALTLTTLTLTANPGRQTRLAQFWPYLSHLLILAALFAWIEARFSGLEPLTWAKISLATLALEWGLSLGRWQPWRQTCWHFGLGLAGLSYGLLFQNQIAAVAQGTETPGWLAASSLWLLTPILLTGLAWLRPRPAGPVRAATAAWLSTGSLVAQLLLVTSSRNGLVVCAIAMGLMLLNLVPIKAGSGAGAGLAAGLTIGFGLGVELAALISFTQLSFSSALLELAATLWLLWLLQEGLRSRFPAGCLGQLYATAAHRWFLGLALLGLLLLTGHLGLAASLNQPIAALTVLSNWLIAAALAVQLWRSSVRQQASELMFYQLAWAAELALVALVGWRLGTSPLDRWSSDLLATLTLGLGLATQVAGDWGIARTGSPQPAVSRSWRPSWQIIPLGYAALGLLFAHTELLGWLGGFGASAGANFRANLAGLGPYTGLYSLAAALIALGVGRRQPSLKPITLAGLLLASGAIYELLIYRLLQASGGSWGDGLALLAGLATLIVWLLRVGQPWLLSYLRLSWGELGRVAHLHWLLGSSLALLAMGNLSNRGFWVWLGVAIGLSAYALLNGRQFPTLEPALEPSLEPEPSAILLSRQPDQATRDWAARDQAAANRWTYAGIAQMLGLVSYSLMRGLPDSTWLAAWAATLAAVGAIGLYFLPWAKWGWSARPWQTMALLWPGTVVLLTVSTVSLQSLLLVAAFYAWIAKTEARPRLSYLGLGLLDWAVLRYLTNQDWLNLTWLSAVLAASLLYVAQYDPALQSVAAKQQRHILRSFAVGLLSLTLLYQAEVETGQIALVISGLTLLGGLALVLLGLVLRTRAFLYMGTITFVFKVLRLFWQLINTDSLLLWASGILVGLIFIWVAATFEARRSQVSALMQYWLTEFERWE